jgi:hypothetical protein
MQRYFLKIKNVMDIKLNIIDKKRQLSYILSFYTFFIAIIALFVGVLFLESKVVLLIISIVMIISGLFMTYTKEYNLIGYINLSEDQITISNHSSQNEIYEINSLTKIIILYREVSGRRYSLNPKSISLTKGTNNYMILEKNKMSKIFEFLLNEDDLPRISKIIDIWRQNKSINIELTNKWGRFFGCNRMERITTGVT